MTDNQPAEKKKVAKTPELYIGRLILIAPLLIAIYAGIQAFLVSQVEPTVLTLDEFRNSPPERGSKVTLTGGGLYLGHHFSNDPEGDGTPTHWWISYVTEEDLPTLLAARNENDYPLEQLVLAEFQDDILRIKFPQLFDEDRAFLRVDLTGAIRKQKDVSLRVKYTVSKEYDMPPSSLYFFEFGGEQTASFNFKGLLILAGILAVPGSVWFLTTFAPPLEPKPSANDWVNHSSTPPPEVLERLKQIETGPQEEAGDSA